MSKMDGLRAMREARYAENTARAKSAAPAAKQAPAEKVPAKRPSATSAAPSGADGADAARPTRADDAVLCGHRAISGRTCTREKGHAAKSHRYS